MFLHLLRIQIYPARDSDAASAKGAALPRDGPSNGRLRYGRASRDPRIDGSPSRNDRKIYRGIVEPATLLCGIRCSTGGTPPSAKITRYFAPFIRCCRASRWATLLFQFPAASFVGNS